MTENVEFENTLLHTFLHIKLLSITIQLNSPIK